MYPAVLQLADLPMKKAFKNRSLKAFVLCNGRGERIRTFDPLVPNQMRYQAALRPDATIVNAHSARTGRLHHDTRKIVGQHANFDE